MDSGIEQEGPPWTLVASFMMGCPVCETTVPIGVLARVVPDEDGQPTLHLEPDMSELWSHTFTHDEAI